MKNYVQEGKTISFVAPSGGVTSGQGLLLNDIFGVVEFTAAQDAEGEMAVVGVFSLPKAAVALNNGDKVYWDDVAKNITDVALGNKWIGVATESVLSGDATVNVRLGQTFDSGANATNTYVTAHTVTAGEDTAGQADINTGFGVAPTTWQAQILRAGVDVKADAIVTALGGGDAGKLRFAEGTVTYAMTAGDVIHLSAFKV